MASLISELRTRPIRSAQLLYEKKLKLKDLQGRPYIMEKFQHDDWETASKLKKGCFVRSRGGAKTKDFVDWLIFHVLRTKQVWIWMACKGGQLRQALGYARNNKFVKEVKRESAACYYVHLWTGDIIQFGIISTSNLGLRVDGIVYDEFEDLKPGQELDIYPQMAGMMTTSSVAHTIYLGTLWVGALFNEYAEMYSTIIRPWRSLPWLVKAGAIQAIIDEGKTPKWEIDMLYECIPTAPQGLLFTKLSTGKIKYDPKEVCYGLDFGALDMCVGVVIKNNKCYVVEEYALELELYHNAFDFCSRGGYCECEGGGYNDSERYGAKSKIITNRFYSKRQSVTNSWKSERQKLARQFDEIIVDRDACPKTWSDIKSSTFGPDGLYFKHPTKSPCHYLDAFFHSLGLIIDPSWMDGDIPQRGINIVEIEQARDEIYEMSQGG